MSDNVSKNSDGQITVKQIKNNKTVETNLDLEDEVLTGVYSAIRDVIAQLIISKGKWEGKVQRGVMRLVKELIEFADQSMYATKQQGGNGITIHQNDSNKDDSLEEQAERLADFFDKHRPVSTKYKLSLKKK